MEAVDIMEKVEMVSEEVEEVMVVVDHMKTVYMLNMVEVDQIMEYLIKVEMAFV